MKVSYSNDTSRGPGYGFLRCSDIGQPAGNEISFCLCKTSERLYLSSQGEWLETQTFLAPSGGFHMEGSDVLLAIGPEVVDQLPMTETLCLYLKTSEGTLKAGLRPANVIYSLDETKGATLLPQPPKGNKDETQEEEKPFQPSDPVGVNEETKNEEPPLSLEGNSTTEETNTQPPAKEDPKESPEASSKSRVLPVILILVVLLAAAGGAFWWYQSKADTEATAPESEQPAPPAKEKEAAPEPPAEKPAPPKSTAKESTPEDTPAPQAAPAAQAPTTEEAVTTFFGGKQYTPAAAAKLSRTLARETQADQDAIYRLYYFAGENGEASVLMDYAACLDPSRPAWGSIHKDPVLAWGVYEKARAAGISQAESAQQSMKQWLQQKASAGDAQAVYWLRSMPQAQKP